MRLVLRCLAAGLLMAAVVFVPGCARIAQRARAGASAPHAVRYTDAITVDGRQRGFTLNLPPGYTSTVPVPLIIAMHGGGGNAAQFEATSLLTPKAAAAGFAVVYPEGTAPNALGLQTWNGGGCCGYAASANIDDVNFIRTLITTLAARHAIDPRRIYATGHSNGAMMSYRLACELADKVAAIAPNAGPLMLDTCAPTRPVPVLHMHSRLDANVPIYGGLGIGPSGVPYPAMTDVMTRWVQIDGCATAPEVTHGISYTLQTWSPCRGATVVQYYLTEDGGHAWPGGLPGHPGSDQPATSIDANDQLLAFFGRFSLLARRAVWLPVVAAV